MIDLKKIAAVAVVAAGLAISTASADHVWINEFHYDNPGADTNEFVEIAVRSGDPFNAADFVVTLYNGNNGAAYGSAVLSDFATSGPISIANSTETITLYTFVFTGTASGGIQNGAPDGLALSNSATNTLISFISYEGAFTAVGGPADGVMSMDVGVSESGAVGSSATTSIALVGTGDRSSMFTWALVDPATSGGINTGQTFDAVPEPSTYMLLGVGLLFCAQRFRRARKG